MELGVVVLLPSSTIQLVSTMAEADLKCFKANSSYRNNENPSAKPAKKSKPMKAKHFRASPDDDCQEDRLSALPDGILCHILSFLPTKLAASTSILSTRWRYIFFGVPKIDLDNILLFHPQQQRGGGENVVLAGALAGSDKKFVDFVNRRLMNQASTAVVSEFRLRCQKLAGRDFLVRSWIHSVLSRNVRVIDIWFDACDDPFSEIEFFTPEVFTCKTLVVLKLCAHACLMVSELVGLPNLKVLHLENFILVGNSTNWVISNPLLDDLRIYKVGFWDVVSVDINSPSLTKLAWHARLASDMLVLNIPSVEYLDVCDAIPVIVSKCKLKSLVKANLSFQFADKSYKDEAYKFCQFICEMSNVKSLRLSWESVESLSRSDHLLPEFLNLTYLEFMTSWDGNWENFEILLNSAPHLEMLVVDMGEFERVPVVHPSCSAKEKPLCLNQHLREVEIKNFSGYQYEFEILRYLLKHGAALQKMSIHASRTMMPKKWPSSAHKKMMKFPRRSKNCEIVLI